MSEPLELAKLAVKMLKTCGLEAVVLTKPASIEVCQGRWTFRYRVEEEERPVRVAARVFGLMLLIQEYIHRRPT